MKINQQHLIKLKQLFKDKKESVFPINSLQSVSNFIFDFDGVLLKECNVIEHGYAWLIRAARENNFNTDDLAINSHDLEQAFVIRPQVKGKS